MKNRPGSSPPTPATLATLILCLGFGVARGQAPEPGGESPIATGTADAPWRVEEVTVQAETFTVVGDLYLPAEGSRHPLAVWVHGSGPLTRQLMAPLLRPQIEVFLKAGFAFFIDDIPGSGASQGQIQSVFRDRALILTREIETLRQRPDIAPDRVGVVGASQAGVVMPLAAKDAGFAFMIAEACVAEASYRQDAYLAEQLAICEGKSPAEAAEVARAIRLRYEADSFPDYVAAAERVNGDETCRMIGIDNPLLTEERFRTRNRSPQRLGSYFDPMPLVAEMSAPVLALFGGKDKNIDSRQGVVAYRQALAVGRNPLSRVEMIAGANHALFAAESGCVRELMAQVEAGEPRYEPDALRTLARWLAVLKDSWD